ncbi:MAG TPA: Holliday junction resolvase RuvX [Terracidiphilus sp.]|nr:Holliday junction resolvase RuvX [Terracidiphilus sp.]
MRLAIRLVSILQSLRTRQAPLWTLNLFIVPGDKGRICPLAIKLVAEGAKLESGKHLRYLGLDIGNRRIGVAVSDELGLTAQPVLTLERRHNSREDLRSLARLCRRYGVAGVVVGNPLHLSGEISPQAARTQAFAAALGELAGLPVHLWDERLTTQEAHRILYEAGHQRQQHRRVVDQVAATLILQEFLDRQRLDWQRLDRQRAGADAEGIQAPNPQTGEPESED